LLSKGNDDRINEREKYKQMRKKQTITNQRKSITVEHNQSITGSSRITNDREEKRSDQPINRRGRDRQTN